MMMMMMMMMMKMMMMKFVCSKDPQQNLCDLSPTIEQNICMKSKTFLSLRLYLHATSINVTLSGLIGVGVMVLIPSS